MRYLLLLPIAFIAAVIFLQTRELSAQSPYNRRSAPVAGIIAGTGITGVTGASASTVITLTSDCALLSLENTSDKPVFARIGTVNKIVPNASVRQYDLASDGVRLAQGTVIGVFGITGASTSGYFEAMCWPYGSPY